MAPGYRNSNRRPNRTGYVDHDIFEGLPVRQWRRDYITVAPPPIQDSTMSQNDIWAIELPHGMPRDSQLLPQHSQDLLRAARSGRIYKRPPLVEEEEVDPEAILGDKPEKKDDDPREKGFTAKTWKQIPRHMEVPDVEFLAKRRKGLVTLSSKATTGPTMMKTKVRREDAAGNEYVEEVIAPRGAQVQGEVIAQTVVADSTVADGFAHPTPPRRKGVPPKKKKMKGPGRGRKKNPIAPTSVPTQIVGVAHSIGGAHGIVGPDGVKIESDGNVNDSALPTAGEDAEMAEGSIAASDDDVGEEGEEGDEGDDDEESVSEMDSPSKPPRQSSPIVSELPHMREFPSLGFPDTDVSGVDDLPGPPLPKLEPIEGTSGSPLKNVAMTASNPTSPLRLLELADDISPNDVPLQEPIVETYDTSNTNDATILDQMMQQEVVETALSILPSPPPQPRIEEVISSTQVLEEEEEEEEMLLDIVENINNANIGAPQDPVVSVPEITIVPTNPTTDSDTILTQEPDISIPESEQEPQPAEIFEPRSAEEDIDLIEHPVKDLVDEPVEDEEPFTDLLGGLERQVEEPKIEPDPTIEESQAEPIAETEERISGEQVGAVGVKTEDS